MEITDFAVVLKRCRVGDPEAWNMIIDAYSKQVFNIALNFIADRDMAADITQEIFIKLYHNLDKYRDEKSFSSWLFAVSRNHCIDFWRKNKKYRQALELDETISSDTMTPEEEAIRESQIQQLRKKILLLEPELRVFLIMRDILNFSYQEISEKFMVPQGTVKSRINRARVKLTELVTQGDDPDEL